MDGITRSRVGLSRSPQLITWEKQNRHRHNFHLPSSNKHVFETIFGTPSGINEPCGWETQAPCLPILYWTYIPMAPNRSLRSPPQFANQCITSAFCPSCCQITSFFSHFFLGSSVMGFSNGLPGTKIRHAAKNQPCFLVQSWSKEISDPVYYVVQ